MIGGGRIGVLATPHLSAPVHGLSRTHSVLCSPVLHVRRDPIPSSASPGETHSMQREQRAGRAPLASRSVRDGKGRRRRRARDSRENRREKSGKRGKTRARMVGVRRKEKECLRAKVSAKGKLESEHVAKWFDGSVKLNFFFFFLFYIFNLLSFLGGQKINKRISGVK